MDDSTLRSTIGDGLRELSALVVLHNTVVAQRLGLGPSDSQFLTLLTNHGPLAAGELATRSGLTTGSVTGVLDRLESAGYVRRDRDPRDRRKVIVSLEPGALERVADHYRDYGEHLERVLVERSTSELQVIARFFADLLATPAAAERDSASTETAAEAT